MIGSAIGMNIEFRTRAEWNEKSRPSICTMFTQSVYDPLKMRIRDMKNSKRPTRFGLCLSASISALMAFTPVTAKTAKRQVSDADICRINLTDGSKEARTICEAKLARYRATQAREIELSAEPYITFRKVRSGLMSADYERTIATLNAAKKSGKGEAAYLLAKLHYEGRGVPQSLNLAAENFQFALDNGFPEAVEDFVSIYLDGRITPVDKLRAQP
jgi:hypothetical protein